jgi:hypothetical protein
MKRLGLLEDVRIVEPFDQEGGMSAKLTQVGRRVVDPRSSCLGPSSGRQDPSLN